jgi:ComF family protein
VAAANDEAGGIGACAVILTRRGAARRPGALCRARCIFSECLNESTLHGMTGAGAGDNDGRADLWTLIERARRTFHGIADDLITTTFPADCVVCGDAVVRSTVVPVCDACREAPRRQTTALCRICGEAMEMDSLRFAAQFPVEGLLCTECRMAPPQFERAVAFSVYEHEVREMVHLLKYERMRGVAKVLGGRLADAIQALRGAAGDELVVVTVPLFPAKQRQRGYNQAELLADAALNELRRRDPDWRLKRISGVLMRRRDTRSQFELTPRGRRRNLQGAFAADKTKLPAGCEVLLVDDIYTTGATARECSRVLLRAGASKVWVATLARAQAVRVAMWEGTTKEIGSSGSRRAS